MLSLARKFLDVAGDSKPARDDRSFGCLVLCVIPLNVASIVDCDLQRAV